MTSWLSLLKISLYVYTDMQTILKAEVISLDFIKAKLNRFFKNLKIFI